MGFDNSHEMSTPIFLSAELAQKVGSETFLSAQYLVNQWLDSDQILMGI